MAGLDAFILSVIIGAWVILIARHLSDRRHGRIPGTEQPPEYLEWRARRKWWWIV